MAYAPWAYGETGVSERTDPVATQGNVNIQVTLDPRSHETARRQQDTDDRLPAGIPDDHKPQKGELAFYSPTSETRRAPSIPGTPQVVAWTAFNGHSHREDIAFLGVIAAGAGDVSEPDMSVQIAGLQTIINTGPQTIHAGQRVVWTFPEAVAHGTGGGGRVCKYRAPNGYSDTRFVAVTYPLDDMGMLAEVTSIMGMRPDEAYSTFGLLRHPSQKEMDPAYILAGIGSGGSHGGHSYKGAKLKSGGLSALRMFRDYSSTFCQATPLIPSAPPTGEHAMAAAIIDYVGLKRARVIGTAVSTALPGRQLDILINKRD